VLADYSDRSGDATHVLREVVDQSLSGVLIATVRDERVLETLLQGNAQVGDRFSMDVGGFAGPASGSPVQIDGTLTYLGKGFSFDTVAVVDFGDRNSLIITPALKQVIWTEELAFSNHGCISGVVSMRLDLLKRLLSWTHQDHSLAQFISTHCRMKMSRSLTIILTAHHRSASSNGNWNQS